MKFFCRYLKHNVSEFRAIELCKIDMTVGFPVCFWSHQWYVEKVVDLIPYKLYVYLHGFRGAEIAQGTLLFTNITLNVDE